MHLSTKQLTRSGTWLLLSLVLLIPTAFAQSVSDGTLTGTVVLTSGESIRGVPVKITSPALVTGERTVTSDENGRFVFLSLPPGTYTVTASLDGFRTSQTGGLILHGGDKADVKITLQQGAYTEEMVVVGDTPIIDTKNTAIDTTFTSEMLDKLPTARNAFYDLAITAPGISDIGAESSWLSSPSAFGSAASDNIFLVNGVNATNPRGAPWGTLVNVNYNTVQEVKILSLGSKAEYGSFSGAAIDVLTKSGGNEFTGDVAYYSMLGNAAENATIDFGDEIFFADENDALTTKPDSSWEGSLTLGGPVLRDRLWFYAGYNKVGAETDTPIWQPLAEWDATLYDLKLTADISTKHRAWLAYHREDLLAGNTSWGVTWDPTMRYHTGTDNDTIQAQYQWVVNDRNLLSAKYLGFDTRQHPTIPSEVGNPGFINWWKGTGGQSIGVGGDFPYVEAQKSTRRTLQADATHYAADFMGEHELKFGVQHTQSEGNWMGGYFQGYANFAYPYGYYGYTASSWPWNCDGATCFRGGPGWGTRSQPVAAFFNRKENMNPFLTVRQADNTGAFLDDTWAINDRFTFNLGVRYDMMGARYGEGAVYEMPNSPGDINDPVFLRSREGTDDIFDFSTWSPRLGLAWTVTADQKTVMRAHYGRYFSPMGVETLRRFGPDMEPVQRETWLYTMPMSEVDTNGNGVLDPGNEVRRATAMLASRTPHHLLSSGPVDFSSNLEVEAGTDSPYTDQFHVSLQRQLTQNLAIEGAVILKKTQNFIAFRPYNEATGEYWEWVKKPFTTFTGQQTQAWEVALKDYDGNGVVDIADARFVVNNTGYRAGNLTKIGDTEVQRTYRGLQLVLNKRYSNRWQGLASVNWSDSDGMAPRTRNQNQYIDGAMIMDTPFGSSQNHFTNNLEGPLPMTPEWMFKVSGSYTIPRIETDFGLRYRYDSGRAIMPVQTLPTFATWMSSLTGVFLGTGSETIVAADPNDADWTPATSIVDLSLSKPFKIAGGYELSLSFDVLNALNENSPNMFGVGQFDYGRVYSIVQPRIFRAGVKFMF